MDVAVGELEARLALLVVWRLGFVRLVRVPKEKKLTQERKAFRFFFRKSHFFFKTKKPKNQNQN